MYSNTLLGYFKNGLTKGHYSTKYLNRDFLNTFISEYNASMDAGIANYPRTKETKFYKENSCAYCAFLELWNEYKNGMNYAKSIGLI